MLSTAEDLVFNIDRFLYLSSWSFQVEQNKSQFYISQIDNKDVNVIPKYAGYQ